MGSWFAYKSDIASDDDLSVMFTERNANQIACICGEVSGNLEIIDIDTKNDPTGKLFEELWEAILDYFNSMPPGLIVSSTPSGGFHIIYRVDSPIDGNKKLASRTDPSKPKGRLSMIETRGEGGYFITSPSPGYNLIMGSLSLIPVISIDVRNDLHDICRTFNQITTIVRDKPKTKILYSFKETPWDHYNADDTHPALDVLLKHGWTVARSEETETFLRRPGSENRWGAVYHHESHITYVFTSSSAFEPEKGYSPTAILAILEHDGDFSAACAELRKNKYGSFFNEAERKAMERSSALFAEGLVNGEMLQLLSVEFEDIDTPTLEAVITIAEKKTRIKKGIFWKKNSKGTLSIIKHKLQYWMQERGYRLYAKSAEEDVKTLVHIDAKRHLIREVPLDSLKKDVKQWIDDTDFAEYEIKDEEITEILFGPSKDAWRAIADWLPVITFDECPILRDTRTTAYIPFTNGVVRITRHAIELISYDDLPKGSLVWASSIRSWDVELMPSHSDDYIHQNPANLFIKRVAGVNKDHDHMSFERLQEVFPDEYTKYMAFITTIGYLLTNYKDPERPYCVIFAEDTADQAQGGGTGKGLLMQMIKHIRSVVTIFGREWDPDSTFAYQRVKLSTDVLLIDDTPPNFAFQRLYNLLTEGITVNRKYKEELYIPYEMSPKIVIITNYDVEAEGEHGLRRQVKVFFSKYFTSKHKPKDEFKKMFFSEDWDAWEWNWFYTFMFTCIHAYFSHDVIRVATTENVKAKQVKLKYREEFYKFMNDVMSMQSDNELKPRKEYVLFDDLYQDFLKTGGLDKHDYSSRRFKSGLLFYCKCYRFIILERRHMTRDSGRNKMELRIVPAEGPVEPATSGDGEELEELPF